MPTVSVIIPLYNKEKAIEKTIRSVLKQSYTDFELIIVDDGSTDGSADIVRKMALADERIIYIYKDNGGVSSARNYGLSKSVGEWIVFIDADDEMLPNNLNTLLKLVIKYKVNVGACNVLLNNEAGIHAIKLRLNKEGIYKNFIKARLQGKVIFPNGAKIFHRLVLGEKPYDENLTRYEDAEQELNVFIKGPIAVSPKPIAIIHSEFAELSKIYNNKKEKDFIFNMDFSTKTVWQKIYMGRFIQEGVCSYKENGKALLKKKYGMNYYWRYVYFTVIKYFNFIYKLKCLFYTSVRMPKTDFI